MQLIAEGIRHSFGGVEVLSGATVAVPAGQVTAFVGPSGSGKTTLLAVLGGLLQPDEGSVAIEADRPTGPVREHVAFIPQTMNVLSDRTVVDNVALGALSAGVTWKDACKGARNHLGAVGLADRSGEPVRRLSGGEVQRVVIARAMASTCDFVLADEPTGQLDRATTGVVVRALREAFGTRGVIIVTHDEQVARSCDVVWEMRDGRLWAR